MNDKHYAAKELESRWYEVWEREGWFAPSGSGKPYAIVIPPPNVTGTLHMGHGFQMTLMDLLIRYHRMCGDRTLWQLGTDHAGIATQMVVDNLVRSEGGSRVAMGREKFIERVWQWKKYSGGTIARQERRLGISGDWSREKFTLDDDLVKAVQTAFIKLYEEGLIYRGKKLVNWDPVLKTAISDLEVLNEETEGSLWSIAYPLVDGNGSVVVATTRPETLFGDVAVAVHPSDQRYQQLIGKMLRLPLTTREIPVIGDENVDPEFGTGCVKITPAHDFNDYATGKRYHLPLINILTPDAHLNDEVPEMFRGLERSTARKVVLAALTEAGLLVKTEKHLLKIPRGERSGAIIEPYLTDQWFVKMQGMANTALEALNEGKIRFIPENWNRTYRNWLDNIEDWCISRQLWWGHRIPAWYDRSGKIYVGKDLAEVAAKAGIPETEFTQEEDVLDTWFSAALWPFATLGWPKKTAEFAQFYPTNVLVTGFDIIFFWVARMVMFGLKFTGEVPFRDIYITGLVRDAHGQKMSKSKGNILDPIDLADGISLEKLVEKRTANLMQQHLKDKITRETTREFPEGIVGYGIDALRFTFCALATTSRDINFDMTRLEGYRNFCTKLWNSVRFALIQLDGFTVAAEDQQQLALADLWIRARLNYAIKAVRGNLDSYRFDLAAQEVYEFVWDNLCAWYLELAKVILNGDYDDVFKQGTRATLAITLEVTLRLMHPFMPFITEELWQKIAPHCGIKSQTIMLEPYPKASLSTEDEKVISEMKWFQSVVIALRNLRDTMGIAPSRLMELRVLKGNMTERALFTKYLSYIKALLRLSEIKIEEHQTALPPTAMTLVGELELHLVMEAGDLANEHKRMQRELNKALKDAENLAHKLNNQAYMTKAPHEVIVKDKTRAAELKQVIQKLKSRLEKFSP